MVSLFASAEVRVRPAARRHLLGPECCIGGLQPGRAAVRAARVRCRDERGGEDRGRRGGGRCGTARGGGGGAGTDDPLVVRGGVGGCGGGVDCDGLVFI